MVTSKYLRELAAELEAEVARLPAVEDAVSDRQREERDGAIRAADLRRRAVALASQKLAKVEADLAELEPWRDALVEFSQEIEEELAERRAGLPPRPPRGGEWTPALAAGDLGAILRSIDFYGCSVPACGWIGREPELEVKTDSAGSPYFACPSCGDDRIEPPAFRTSANEAIHPALRARFAREDWTATPDLRTTERRIAQAESRRDEALESVAAIVRDRGQRAA